MKRNVLLIIFLLNILAAQKISPYLQHNISLKKDRAVQKKYGLIIRADEAAMSSLEKSGINISTRRGDLAAVTIAEDELGRLMNTKGVQRINYSPILKVHNSKAARYQNVQAAYIKGYTGSDVIVGVIDTGIDFYHPMFLEQNGRTRILAIWDQTDEGDHPADYDYGFEYSEAQINQDFLSASPLSIVKQKDIEGHGTHVAGSMAGRDFSISPDDTLSGGAKEANLVIVKTTLENAHVADAAAYIFKKAEALGKPAVVNISLGNQYGPHDGTTDGNKLFDSLTGPGRIIVRSAGNEGSSHVHYMADDVTGSSQIQFGYTRYVTVWLEKGDNINSVSLSWSGGSINNVTKGNNKSTDDVDLYLLGSSQWNNGKISVYVLMDNQSLNGETFTLSLDGLSDQNNNGHIIRHAWADSSVMAEPYGAFSQGSLYSRVHYPYTLSDDACADKIITVGAFISRYNWPASDGHIYSYNNAGTNGERGEGGIAVFSSIGPTVDERQKPEITAGGTIILSARSKDSEYAATMLPPRPYKDDYAYKQGTSMASPIAAGAIALLLERYPQWGPDEVKAYLSTNAGSTSSPYDHTQSELKTKNDPNIWDPVFGYGTIDLTAAFDSLKIVVPDPEPVNEYYLYANYPNPFNPETHIKYNLEIDGRVELTVYNLLGQKIKTLVDEVQTAKLYDNVVFDGSGLAGGVYIYKIKSGKFIQARKMLLLR